MTWNQYHDRSKITQELIDLGQEFLRRFVINYDIVKSRHFKEALKKDPIIIGLYAWPIPQNGVYPRVDYRLNHVVVCFGTIIWRVFDNYIDVHDGDFIKRLATNYKMLHYGYRVVLNQVKKKDPINLNVKNNDEDMKFYKNSLQPESPKVYQLGEDALYHHVVSQPVFEGLYGDVSKAQIEEVEIPPEKVGFTIYNKQSILELLLNLFSFFKGKK